MTRRQFNFLDRTLALLLSLALTVPSVSDTSRVSDTVLSSSHLRPLNAGLEERNPVNEQLEAALLIDQSTVTTSQAAGMEEGKGVRGRIFTAGLVTAALAALLGLYGWLRPPSQPPASPTPSTTPPPVSAFPEPESVEETIRRTEWDLEIELARVDAMTQINGVPIEEIERRARPEADATTGFLGREDRLKEVIKEDLATLHRLGWTKEEMARHLKNIVRIAKQSKADRVILQYFGQPLEVIYIRSHGGQDSIFRNPDSPEGNPDNWSWNAETLITNLNNELHVLVGGDVSDDNEGIGVIGYIERHGFFEGGGVDNPYRVDPAVLDAILTGKEVTEELKRLESVSSGEFLEQRWQEELKTKIEAEKEAPRSPQAEEAFKGVLKKMPPEVVRELLELARKRDQWYVGKWEDLSERYNLEIRFSYASGDVLPYYVLHFPEGNLNLSQQVEVLEAFLNEAGQLVPPPKPGAEGPAPDPAGLEEGKKGSGELRVKSEEFTGESFLDRYGRVLEQQGGLEEVKGLIGAGKRVVVVPGEVLTESVTVIAYVVAALLKAVEGQLQEDNFIVTVSYPDNGKVSKLAVIVKLAGALLPKEPSLRLPIVALQSTGQVGLLTPAFIQWVALNDALAGQEIGPPIAQVTFQNEAGQTLHALIFA